MREIEDGETAGEVYREGPAEAAAYVVTALLIIGLGITLGAVVLNWIVGPGLAIVFVVVLTPLCRRAYARWNGRRS
jgi:hypothetical protein